MVKNCTYAVLMVVLVSGCIYSLEMMPPYEPMRTGEYTPLAVSIRLGDISSCILQTCRKRSLQELQRIDEVFREAVDQENIVQFIKPQGSVADIYIDAVHYPDVASNVSRKRKLYRDILTLTGLGFITPLPFPFYIDSQFVVTLGAHLEDQEYRLKEYSVHTQTTIWSASIIGARYKRQVIQDRIIRYLVPIIADYIRRDYGYFKKVSSAIHEKDHAALAQLVGAQAQDRS